jgi:hypothetical protein
MILEDVGVYLEHVQVIRSNIGPELVEKYRDVQNEPIWANVRKKAKGIIHLGLFFKQPLYFLETEYNIWKIPYKCYIFIISECIQLRFFYILINIKFSSYNHISKSQKNWHFINCYSMDLQKYKILFSPLHAQLNLT